jgi:hypothetical protein
MLDEDPSKRGSFESIYRDFENCDKDSERVVGHRLDENRKVQSMNILRKRFSISEINGKTRIIK